MIRRATFIAPLLALCIAMPAVETPTREQWEPVKTALDSEQAGAEAQLDALLAKFPNWSDGHLVRAQRKAAQQDWAGTWDSAKKALTLDRTNAPAGAVGIQAKGQLAASDASLIPHIEMIAKYFTDATDKDGWVAYQAAFAFTSLNQLDKAAIWLDTARTRLNKMPQPKEFLFLDGRIATLSKDLLRGEASFSRAVAADPAYWDAWYELGRVRLALGGKVVKAEDKRKLLADARDCFDRLTKQDPKDDEALTYLGRTELATGRVLEEAGELSAAENRYADASQALAAALRLKPDHLPTRLALGETESRRRRYAEALPYLQAAVDQGVTDRDVLFNLATALTNVGRAGDAQAILAKAGAKTGSELVTAGMSAYRAGNLAFAADLLTRAAAMDDVTADPQIAGSSLRFAGHALRRQAEAVAMPTEGPVAEATAKREKLLDDAAERYRAAGDLRDWAARRWYIGVQTERSPDLAYAAGWQQVSWGSGFTTDGWGLVIGNYGAAATGGKGLGGMWDRKPLHVIIWGLLILLPVGLFTWSRLRSQPTDDGKPPRGSTRPAPATKPPTGRTARPGTGTTVKPGTGRGAKPGTGRAAGRPTPRPSAGNSPFAGPDK
jgi:tetratricopeptide (TPR) repeat protein